VRLIGTLKPEELGRALFHLNQRHAERSSVRARLPARKQVQCINGTGKAAVHPCGERLASLQWPSE
jgi:hypothetical protein